MYELLYGFTPFRGAKRDATFENILKRPLAFPSSPEISSDCQARPCSPRVLSQSLGITGNSFEGRVLMLPMRHVILSRISSHVNAGKQEGVVCL